MDALSEGVEILAPVGAANDDLAVEHVAPGGEAQLGKVATERFAVARLQEDLLAVDEGQAAEAVELDLVDVLLAGGQLLAGERELRLERRDQRARPHSAARRGSAPLASGTSSPVAGFARLGCTRRGSPRCLRKCGGQGASPSPSRSSRAASSSSASSEPG